MNHRECQCQCSCSVTNQYLENVRRDGLWVRHLSVKEQTHQICIEAVKQNGMAIQHIIEQTPEICLTAVRSNGMALSHIKHKTTDIVVEAIKTTPGAIHYSVKNLELCLLAIKSQYKINSSDYNISYLSSFNISNHSDQQLLKRIVEELAKETYSIKIYDHINKLYIKKNDMIESVINSYKGDNYIEEKECYYKIYSVTEPTERKKVLLFTIFKNVE